MTIAPRVTPPAVRRPASLLALVLTPSLALSALGAAEAPAPAPLAPVAATAPTAPPAAGPAAPAPLPPTPSPPAALALPANLVFADEFDAAPVAALDGRDDQGALARWRTSLWFGSGYDRQGGGQAFYADTATRPGFHASRVAYDAFSVAGGVLAITAVPRATPIPGFPKLHYLSGILTTIDSFSIDYGYFEVRLRCPGAPGGWTAFFLYPADDYFSRPSAKYTSWEMDFLEVLGSGIDKLHVTTHQKTDHDAKNTNDESVITTGRNDDGFHVFGFDKRAGSVDIWRDGVHLLTKPTSPRMTTAGYLCLVLDVGTDGGWAGTPDAGRYPQVLQVDYVRVYRTAATTVIAGPSALVQMGKAGTDGK